MILEILLGLVILIFAVREWQHDRMVSELVCELSSKIKAKDLFEYKAEPKKQKVQEVEKPKTISDPVLGPDY